jgi:large subunit ribosomal protein L24
MKFKINDKVIVTAGKDKGKKSIITKVLPPLNKVIVKDANIYAKHHKGAQNKKGEIIRVERPLPVSNVAILNDQDKADRIGYKIENGQKQRIYKKTGSVIPVNV